MRHEEKVQQRKAIASGCMALTILLVIIIIAIVILATHGAAIHHFLSHLPKGTTPTPPTT
jgi:flagellar basal body-associated protein FliL